MEGLAAVFTIWDSHSGVLSLGRVNYKNLQLAFEIEGMAVSETAGPEVSTKPRRGSEF